MPTARSVFSWILFGIGSVGLMGVEACRATVAGDPNRPIKIEAHITLDIRQVKETANSIEDVVSGKAPAAPAQKPHARLIEWGDSAAWADAPQLKFTTPEVQKAIDSRRSRFDYLKKFKAQGLIGEDKEGHLTVLGSGPEVDEVGNLVEMENRDRETIYTAIVDQNNLSADAIAAIRSTFAEVQREKADPGEKIQLPSGEWKTK